MTPRQRQRLTSKAKSLIIPVQCYMPTDCGLYCSLTSALERQIEICLTHKAQVMFKAGKSLGEIFTYCDKEIPDPILHSITKHSLFSIPHWQCKDKAGYRITTIHPHDMFTVYGDVGSHTGPYGNNITLSELIRYAKHRYTILTHPTNETRNTTTTI